MLKREGDYRATSSGGGGRSGSPAPRVPAAVFDVGCGSGAFQLSARQFLMEAEMTRTSGKVAADLGSLLGMITGRKPATGRRCWPGPRELPDVRRGQAKVRRGCWPDPRDLPRDDISPEEAIKKIARGRQI